MIKPTLALFRERVWAGRKPFGGMATLLTATVVESVADDGSGLRFDEGGRGPVETREMPSILHAPAGRVPCVVRRSRSSESSTQRVPHAALRRDRRLPKVGASLAGPQVLLPGPAGGQVATVHGDHFLRPALGQDPDAGDGCGDRTEDSRARLNAIGQDGLDRVGDRSWVMRATLGGAAAAWVMVAANNPHDGEMRGREVPVLGDARRLGRNGAALREPGARPLRRFEDFRVALPTAEI